MPFGSGNSITEGGACGWYTETNLEKEAQEKKAEQEVTVSLFSMPQYSVCHTVIVFGGILVLYLQFSYLYTELYFIVLYTYSVM